MTIRTTITLLTLPLFLLLAIANGALLYFQEEAEISAALNDQAEAAAVTSAEFVAGLDRPFATLAEPLRAQALAAAARRLPGIDALYLVGVGTPPLPLFTPAHALDTQAYSRPSKVEIRPMDGATGDRHVVALAPAGPSAFVIARIDAEPLMRQLAATRRQALAIILASCLIALSLSWVVARRIAGDLQVSAAAIAAIGGGQDSPGGDALTIREAKDLADAVRLMQANNAAAERRDRLVLAHNDRQRTPATAFAAWRLAEFAPIAAKVAGRKVALRIVGPAPLGAFFALCENGQQAMIVIGRCEAPGRGDALASALAARRFLEENLFAMPADECLALARDAYGIAALETVAWQAQPASPLAVPLLFLTDDASAHGIAAFGRASADAAPEDLIDGLVALLSPAGVIAAVEPA